MYIDSGHKVKPSVAETVDPKLDFDDAVDNIVVKGFRQGYVSFLRVLEIQLIFNYVYIESFISQVSFLYFVGTWKVNKE